jgi:signal transduction histidine kinase
MLDLLGLSDAIEWYAQKFQNETGIRCRTVTCINDQKIDRVVSTALFRIFQDMLANIIGHSGSSSVNVSLAERKGYLTLLVHDDGQVGIDQNENKGQLSFGIEGMRHRAEEFGGNFRIFNFPKSGVILIARIPLASKEV